MSNFIDIDEYYIMFEAGWLVSDSQGPVEI
jgi:hypothetical protein